MEYTFDATFHEIPENGSAYVIFPWDIRKEFTARKFRTSSPRSALPRTGWRDSPWKWMRKDRMRGALMRRWKRWTM